MLGPGGGGAAGQTKSLSSKVLSPAKSALRPKHDTAPPRQLISSGTEGAGESSWLVCLLSTGVAVAAAAAKGLAGSARAADTCDVGSPTDSDLSVPVRLLATRLASSSLTSSNDRSETEEDALRGLLMRLAGSVILLKPQPARTRSVCLARCVPISCHRNGNGRAERLYCETWARDRSITQKQQVHGKDWKDYTCR